MLEFDYRCYGNTNLSSKGKCRTRKTGASQPSSSHHLLEIVELTVSPFLPPSLLPSTPFSLLLSRSSFFSLALLVSSTSPCNIPLTKSTHPYHLSPHSSKQNTNLHCLLVLSLPPSYSNRSCKTPKSGVFPPLRGLKSWFESFIVTNEPRWVTFEFRVCWSYCENENNNKAKRGGKKSAKEGE